LNAPLAAEARPVPSKVKSTRSIVSAVLAANHMPANVVTRTSNAMRGLQISTRSEARLRVAVIVTLTINFLLLFLFDVVAG